MEKSVWYVCLLVCLTTAAPAMPEEPDALPNNKQSWIANTPPWFWTGLGGLGSGMLILAFANKILDRKIKKRTAQRQDDPSQFKSLFEEMLDGGAIYQAVNDGGDFVCTDINNAGLNLLKKKKPEEIIGRRVTEIFPGITTMGLFDTFYRVWRTGNPEVLQPARYADDGLDGWFENHVFKLPSGRITAFFNDVSDRIHCADQVQSQQAFLDSVIDQSPIPMWVADLDGTIIRTNQALCSKLNLESSQLVGHYNILEDKNLQTAGMLDKVKAVFEHHETVHIRTFWKAADAGDLNLSNARDLHVEATIIPILDRAGELSCVICQWEDITEQKRAQEESEEQRRQFEQLVTNLPGTVYRCRNKPDQAIEFISEGVRSLTGYAPEDFTGPEKFPFTNLICEADRDRVQNTVQAALSTASVYELEYRIRSRDGQEKWVWERGEGVYSDSGNLLLLEGFITDISDRKNTALAVRHSKEHLMTTLTSIGDAVISTDNTGRITLMNPVAEKLTEWRLQEAAGKPLNEIFWIMSAQSGKTRQNPVAQVLKTGQIMERADQTLLISKSGREIPIADSAAPIKNTEGDITGVVLVFRDQTKERTDRLKLETSEAKYRTLFEHMVSAFALHEMIFNEHGVPIDYRFLEVNPAFESLTGLKASETIGRTVKEILPNTENRWLEIYGRVVKTGESVVFEEYAKELDKYFLVHAFRPESGRFAVVFSDITERKRIQEALEKRILALTRPLEGKAEISFDELFEVKEIQRIQDEFSKATGVAAIITTPTGQLITKPSNIPDLCCNIIHKTEKGAAHCFISDNPGSSDRDPQKVLPCLSGISWDAEARISADDHHIATWRIWQVHNEDQSDEAMRSFAKEIGADEAEFMKAFRQVPLMSRKHFQEIAQTRDTLAEQLSNSAYQNLQQARLIHELKETEEALRKLTEEQNLILSNTSFGFALVKERTFTWVNPCFSEMLGIPIDELCGESTRILYPSEKEFEAIGSEVYETLARNERVDQTIKHCRRDGTILWGRLIGKALDPKQSRAGSLWMLEDISNKVASENELNRLSKAIEQSPETVVITDPEGCIQYVNPAFESVTGYTIEEAMGQNPRMLQSGQQGEAFYDDLWKTISSGQNWEGRLINKHKSGSFYTEEASISPVKDFQGNIIHYVAVKRDISEDLIREDELRQAQKMDAVGQLASGVAHDFNNILQGIQGFSELLQLSLDKDSLEHRNATEIHKAANRAVDLTRKLLMFSRKQQSDPQETNLNDAVLEAEALLHILMGERFKLNLELEESPAPIIADSSELSQIIMNLAVNARDAMPKGGTLSISTCTVKLTDKDVVTIANARPGRFACLSVTDTGTGMKAEIQERIFDPFFTTKGVGSGTGLGLSLIYGIVQQSGGWINVYSKSGLGTTFRIYFPCMNPGQESGGPTPPGARILLAEDNPDVAKIILKVLSTAGYDLTTASSAAEGIALYKQQKGNFDLLLSEQELPGRGGSELADALRTMNPELPVLILCDQIDRSSPAGTDYLFIEKPFTNKKLIDSMNRCLK